MSLQYTVVYEKDEIEGGWIASVPVLHCHTQGETREEAEQNIHEAILCCLEGFTVVGKEIPIEDETTIKPIQISFPAA